MPQIGILAQRIKAHISSHRRSCHIACVFQSAVLSRLSSPRLSVPYSAQWHYRKRPSGEGGSTGRWPCLSLADGIAWWTTDIVTSRRCSCFYGISSFAYNRRFKRRKEGVAIPIRMNMRKNYAYLTILKTKNSLFSNILLIFALPNLKGVYGGTQGPYLATVVFVLLIHPESVFELSQPSSHNPNGGKMMWVNWLQTTI